MPYVNFLENAGLGECVAYTFAKLWHKMLTYKATATQPRAPLTPKTPINMNHKHQFSNNKMNLGHVCFTCGALFMYAVVLPSAFITLTEYVWGVVLSCLCTFFSSFKGLKI